MTRRIAVIGGGIAGLAVAAALDRRRFEVTVYEAAPERATGGSALGMWPAARRALARIDALGAVAAGGWRIRGGAVRDLNGRVLFRAGGLDLLMVERSVLLAALEAALPASVRRVFARVAEPQWLDADVVIGADGVRSAVRPLVRGEAGGAGSGAERRPTRWLALRGLAEEAPDPEVIGEYWGAGRLFGIAPIGADRTYWFSCHESELGEPLDPADALAEARLAFPDAAPAVRERLDAADERTLANRLWVAPPMRRYVNGRYVVVGDAAHAMVPNLGRGACEALVDGVSLATALNAGGHTSIGGLSAWQARRVPSTQAARIASAMMMRLAVSGRIGSARTAMSAALSRVGPSRADR
ncbi:FAD-dependent oxidoreductase [Microlunatus ginsengisoli]|uniref:FAD-dependent oxidoreductase n=1 Tax=Microlunatus ginsengisoli TaxID=363863 RepID=A0ABP6ZN83_9ACTN